MRKREATARAPASSLVEPALAPDVDRLVESERWLDAQLAGEPVPPVLVVVGLGNGYLLDVLERRRITPRVLALEPDPEVGRAFMNRRNWSGWSENGRLMYLVGPDYIGADEAWRLFPDAPTGFKLLVSPAFDGDVQPKTIQALQVVKRILVGARENADARRAFAGPYLLNTLRNLPVIARSVDVSALFNRFAGVAGIIVSAGPSLDRSLDQLRAVGDAVLVAVDTALGPLVTAGVQPHFVVAVDPSELNARHLAEVPDVGRTWLVGEGSLAPSAFEMFEERICIFKVSTHHPWPWLAAQGLDRGTLRAWGSVATSAFDLALRMGCDPIVFVGQDLAYTDGRPYCRGTIFEEDWAVAVAGGSSLETVWSAAMDRPGVVHATDIHGADVKTNESMLSVRDWLATQCAAASDRRFINATGAGILFGPAIRQASFEELLAEWNRGQPHDVCSRSDRGD